MLRFLHTGSAPIPLVFLPLLVLGCDSGADAPVRFSVRDSANVQIVESSEPILGPGVSWTISAEPNLQIGETEGEEPYLFSRIRSVFQMEDERIVVCDGGSRTIRFFSPSGEFLNMVGGSGEGPGEFRSLIRCYRWEDGFLGTDRARAPLFGRDGTPVKTISFPTINGQLPHVQGAFSDGSLLLYTERPAPGLSPLRLPPGLHDLVADVFHVNPEGQVGDSLVGFRSARLIGGSDFPHLQAFGPNAQFMAAGGKFFYGWPEDYEIRVFNGAWELEKLIRRSWKPSPVTAGDREWWAATLINGPMPGGGDPTPGARRARTRISEVQVYPDTHAAFDLLKMDAEGCVWVRRSHARVELLHFNPLENVGVQRTWDVFDPEGRWLTTVYPPVDLEIHDIGSDYILGLWRNDLGVEYVREYSLQRFDEAGT